MGNQQEAYQFFVETGELYDDYNETDFFEGFGIIGPPGTGKTFIICVGSLGYCLRTDERGDPKKVLICTKTNYATVRIMDCFEREIFEASNVPEEVRVRIVKRLVNKFEDIQTNPRWLQKYCMPPNPSQYIDQHRWGELEYSFRRARIFVGTVYAAEKFVRNSLLDPTLIVFDEASQLNPPEFTVAYYAAGHNLISVGLVGDPSQLRPVATMRDLNQDIMSYLLGLFSGLTQKITRVTQLNVQLRMNPVIAGLSNRYGNYPHRVDNAPVTHERVLNNYYEYNPATSNRQLQQIIDPNNIVVFIDTTHLGELVSELRTGRGSRANIAEAEIAIGVNNLLRRSYRDIPEEEIRIISPYVGQIEELRGVNAGTVDSFQGQEAEVIIVSLVRTTSEGGISFISDWNRLNVSLSRARCKLILIGHSDTLRLNPITFEPILEYCNSNEGAITVHMTPSLKRELDEFLR